MKTDVERLRKNTWIIPQKKDLLHGHSPYERGRPAGYFYFLNDDDLDEEFGEEGFYLF